MDTIMSGMTGLVLVCVVLWGFGGLLLLIQAASESMDRDKLITAIMVAVAVFMIFVAGCMRTPLVYLFREYWSL